MEADALDSRTSSPRALHVLVVLLLAVPILHAVLMARAGFGYILDDWYTLRNAHFDGAVSAVGGDGALWPLPGSSIGNQLRSAARPGAWLVYGVVFGVLDDHPGLILALLTAIRAGTALAIWRLLSRFVSEPLAAVVAVVWVLLPVTSSLEFWASAAGISLSLLLAVAGCVALDRAVVSNRAPWMAGLLLASAALTYEAVVPAAAVGVVAVGLRRTGWDVRRLRHALAVPAVALVLASLLVVLNWDRSKATSASVTDFSPVFGAHLGWGVVGGGVLGGFAALALLAVVGWSVAAMALPTLLRPARTAEQFVASGVGLIAVSLVPFAFYAYEPQGVGDRVNVTASIGTALIWTGGGLLLWRWKKPLALTVAAVALAAMTSLRLRLIDAYSWAADEADRIVAAIPCSVDGEPVIAGPRPDVRHNVTSFLHADDHLEPAAQMVTDMPDLQVRVILDPTVLADAGGPDIDLRHPRPCER